MNGSWGSEPKGGVGKACRAPDSVQHFKGVISCKWERFFFFEMWRPSLLSSTLRPSPSLASLYSAMSRSLITPVLLSDLIPQQPSAEGHPFILESAAPKCHSWLSSSPASFSASFADPQSADAAALSWALSAELHLTSHPPCSFKTTRAAARGRPLLPGVPTPEVAPHLCESCSQMCQSSYPKNLEKDEPDKPKVSRKK